jgi:hypothetical protein
VSETEASTVLPTSQIFSTASVETEITTGVSGNTNELSTVEVTATTPSQLTSQLPTETVTATTGSIETGNLFHSLFILHTN